MIQCSRFYTDLNFKKRVIINSCSLRNLKWGEKDDNMGRKSVIESNINHNVLNTNIKRLISSNSTEKKKIEENLNKEEELKRKEELQRKREMSYRARKRIILRIRGSQDETEEQKKVTKEKEEKNKMQKIRKIEIKLPLSNNVKFKRVNSNNLINYNKNNINNNDIEFFEKKTNTNQDNIDEVNNVIDNNNNDNNLNNEVKNNFVFYRNIRNIYKKNIIKDISVLTDKGCKILKVEKKCKEQQNKTYNDEKINKHFNKNVNNFNKKNVILNKDKKDKIDKYNSKIEYKNGTNINNNFNNNHAMLKYLENQRNKKYYYNIDNQVHNDKNVNINDLYYSINSTKKKLAKDNSAHLENQKQNNENITNLKEINNDNNKKTRLKRLENSEKRDSYNFSFFNCFQTKRNKINQSEINLESVNYKNSDKTRTFKLDTHSHKSFKNERINSNLNMINLRILSNHYINKNKFNSIESECFEGYLNKDMNNFDTKLYIIHFFEELIDICNSLDNRSLLGTLLNNFNQKYYIINDKYNKEYFNNFFKENENFEYIFKHFGLVLISLIFLSKDETLYNNCFLNTKDILIKLIYSSLNYVEIDGNKENNKIYNFIKINDFQSIIPNHRYILNLINILFDNKKEYIPLKDALEQLHNIIIKKDYHFLIKVINDSILFCYNSKPKSSFNFPFFSFKNNILSYKNNKEIENNYNTNTNIPNNYYSNLTNNNYNITFNNNSNIIINNYNANYNNISNNTCNNINNTFNNKYNNTTNNINKNTDIEGIPTTPFIKTPMKKKFCLVLDIDETISHTLKLSFGGYFFLRPGAKGFLEEISKYYEIIIFTSSQKKYADKILNKIDVDGNLISHRLYKTHVQYENGKTVKNLNMIGRDLTKTIFVDNLRSNAKYNLSNLCPITTWISDIFDNKLIKLKDKLIYIATCGKYDNDITQGL